MDAGAPDAALDAGAEVCSCLIADLAARRRAALAQGAVAAVAMGAYMPPGMQLMAWMGGSRPSDLLACLRAKLAALGEDALPGGAGAALVALQTHVAGQQASIAAAWTGLSERLARTAAVAQFVRAALGGGGGGGGSGGAAAPRPASGHPPLYPAHRPAAGRGSPAVAGIVSDMASLLGHAEDLRQLVVDRVCGRAEAGGLGLPPRAVALYWVGVGDLVRLDDAGIFGGGAGRPGLADAAAAGGGGGKGLRVRAGGGGEQ
jgi:hypothetical protein